MQPFLELPQIIVNNNEQTKEVLNRIQPSEIAQYYEGFFLGTIVVLKSGASFTTLYTVSQLDTILEEFDKKIKTQSNKFGILKIKLE